MRRRAELALWLLCALAWAVAAGYNARDPLAEDPRARVSGS